MAVEPGILVTEVERRLEELERLPDPAAQEKATAVVQALLDLYGAGLERIIDQIAARDEGELARALSEDELVAHLLLLHGLHPVALEQRVREALEQVRPYLESHGGNVELLAVQAPTVRLRLQGSCSGCPSSAMTLKLAIENAIRREAPEIEEVLAQDGGAAEAAAPTSPLIQLEISPGLLDTGPVSQRAAVGSWSMVGGLPELSGGGTVVKTIGGEPILFLRAAGNLYGYRPACPECHDTLSGALLAGTHLTCGGCGNRYDVMRAGRCLDSPHLHLEPVPLLVGEDGLVKVALEAAV